MNNLITILLLLITIPIASAQSDDARVVQHEWGINATSFVNNFLSFNDGNVSVGSFLVSYRRYSDKKRVFRMGMDLNLSNTIDELDDETNRVSYFVDVDWRIGWERQIPIKERWTFLTGMDLVTGFFYRTTSVPNSFEPVDTKDRNWKVGTGPYAGLQFNINDRMGIFTESTFYLLYFNNRGITDFENVFLDDIIDQNHLFNFNVTLPTALYFFVKF